MTSATDCPNCGAPKHGAVCEYCGTELDGSIRIDIKHDCEPMDVARAILRTWDGEIVKVVTQ